MKTVNLREAAFPMADHTPGPWMIATSNSWRRILSRDGESVCEPIKQNDGHPDLYFRNGGEDGPDARLIAAAPGLLEDNAALRERLRLADEALAHFESYPAGSDQQGLALLRRACAVNPKESGK